jgi:hypothetical protein
MTEEEAKTKWCPQTMASDNWDKCQGTACMVWQWFPQSENYTENLATGDRTYLEPAGYCGLAGGTNA